MDLATGQPSSLLNHAALRTPPRDGDVLIEPPAPRLPELVERNRRLLDAAPMTILGAPPAAIRSRERRRLGLPPDAPLIVLGHQPEFIHPGVWAKNVVAARLAARLSGRALHLVVDENSPGQTWLAVPELRDGFAELARIPWTAERDDRPYEDRPALSAPQIDRLGAAVRRALGEVPFSASLMPAVLAAMKAAPPEERLVGQMTAGRRAIDAAFDLHVDDRPLSAAWDGLLPAEMLREPRRFANCYNRALDEERAALGIRSRTRPIPDLHVEERRVELPLWAFEGPHRRRLFVEPRGTARLLFADATAVGEVDARRMRDPDEATAHLRAAVSARLRPRALALTLWARLLLGDVFVHGIGGAKYDRITDGLIRGYFGVEPPALACVSATLHLPLPQFDCSAADLERAIRLARDLRHNPQRHLDGDPRVVQLHAEVEAALRESVRLRESEPAAHAARRRLFERVRALRAEMLSPHGETARRADARIARVRREAAHDAVARGREYFAGLYPREKLARLVETIDAAAL